MNTLEKRIEALEERNQPDPPPVQFKFEVDPPKGPIKVTIGKKPENTNQKEVKS